MSLKAQCLFQQCQCGLIDIDKEVVCIQTQRFLTVTVDEFLGFPRCIEKHERGTIHDFASSLVLIDPTSGKAIHERQPQFLLLRRDQRLKVLQKIRSQHLVLGDAVLLDNSQALVGSPFVWYSCHSPLTCWYYASTRG